MAYDHWGDYEKHLNAMRDAHATFLREYNSLSAREDQYKRARVGPNLIAAQNALSEFSRYINAAVQAGRTTQQLCNSSKAKLDAYIQLVKPFPQSRDHVRNIDAVSKGVEDNIRALQARLRAVRGY